MSADRLAKQWSEEGYIKVVGMFDSERVERLKSVCESILDQWRVENPEKGEPGGGPESNVMRHLNHPSYGEHRLEILKAAASTSVLETASVIFDGPARFHCTSLFFNPIENSRDGNWHRDSQFRSDTDQEEQRHLNERAHAATGVQLQVALIENDDVEFVPASHLRWDTPEEYHIRKADEQANNRSNNMPGAIRIALKPGDAVAFNPLGIHRGRYYIDIPRLTLMLTYRAAQSPKVFDYFSDQPWFLSDGYLTGLSAKVRTFYKTYIDTYREDWLTNTAAKPWP